MINYNFIKNINGTFTLTNNETTPIIINISSYQMMTNLSLYTNYTLVSGGTLIVAPTIIGNYKLIVTKGIETKEQIFIYTADLINYFIKDSIELLCGDDCVSCREKKQSCKDTGLTQCNKYQSLLNQLLFLWYVIINDNYSFNLYIKATFQYYFSSLIKNICKETFSFAFLGNPCLNEELFKKMIAIYYIGFYLKEYNSYTSQSDKDFINSLYQIDKIKECINTLGLSFEKLNSFYSTEVVENNRILEYYAQWTNKNLVVGVNIFDITDGSADISNYQTGYEAITEALLANSIGIVLSNTSISYTLNIISKTRFSITVVSPVQVTVTVQSPLILP